MRNAQRWVIVATVSLLASIGAGPGEEPATIALFDGKTLDGWKKSDFPGAGAVKVEDGAIVIDAGRSISGITTTREDLPKVDYELTYEAMRRDGDDFFAAATFPVGPSFITLVNGGWSGTVTGLSSLDGADASENETNQSITYRNGTWYRFRVRVTGRMIRVRIDDKPVIDLDYQDRQVSTRIETRSNQPLGFATWKTAGAIRKVEVRRLTPAEVAADKG